MRLFHAVHRNIGPSSPLTPETYGKKGGERHTWPLGLHRIVVHSGPLPHLVCSLNTKSLGGWCISRSLLPDQTVIVVPEGNRSRGGKRYTATGWPPTFCCRRKFPNSSSWKSKAKSKNCLPTSYPTSGYKNEMLVRKSSLDYFSINFGVPWPLNVSMRILKVLMLNNEKQNVEQMCT